MQPISVIAIFCEDIREEKSGGDILVGILPDNLHVPNLGMMPKLGVYVRVHIDSGSPPPKSMTAKLIAPDGSEIALPFWDPAVIAKGFSDAKSSGTPLVGLLLKAVFSPFPITAAGLLICKITIDGTDYIGSSLKIISVSASTSAPTIS